MVFVGMSVHRSVSLKGGTVGKSYKRTVVGRVSHIADGTEVSPAVRYDLARMSETFSQTDEEPTYTVSTSFICQVNFVIFSVFDQESW